MLWQFRQKVPKITKVTAAIIITGISTVGLVKTASSPLPIVASIIINTIPPKIIPKAPAILVKKTDSKII